MSDIYKIRLRKGDLVVVRSGSQKGKSGKILSVLPKDNSVIVEGINIVKKHQKPNKKYPQGGVVEINKPINVSKLGFFDSTAKKASRIGYRLNKDGSKSRILKTSGKEIK